MSLFPPPKIIKTEVFATVPGRYRKKGVVTHWVETHREAVGVSEARRAEREKQHEGRKGKAARVLK